MSVARVRDENYQVLDPFEPVLLYSAGGSAEIDPAIFNEAGLPTTQYHFNAKFTGFAPGIYQFVLVPLTNNFARGDPVRSGCTRASRKSTATTSGPSGPLLLPPSRPPRCKIRRCNDPPPTRSDEGAMIGRAVFAASAPWRKLKVERYTLNVPPPTRSEWAR